MSDGAPRLPREVPSFRAVVMDMDGLALDTEDTYCHAWRTAAADLGFALNGAFCRSLFGHHVDDVDRALVAACGTDFDLHRFHESARRHWYAYLETHGIAKMPDLDRLLAVLTDRGLPYALATNSDAPYAFEVLRLAEALDRFPVIVTRDQVPLGKPDPGLFLEAARRLGIPAAECLGLEDSEPGLLALKRAGMIPGWIPPRHVSISGDARREGVWVWPSLGALADHLQHHKPSPGDADA
jgi:HAD superfamily hydrolase (TIGR01509 family)